MSKEILELFLVTDIHHGAPLGTKRSDQAQLLLDNFIKVTVCGILSRCRIGHRCYWTCFRILSAIYFFKKSPPVRERHPATGGARPLQAHRRRHGAAPLDAAGDLVANGWPRPVDVDGT